MFWVRWVIVTGLLAGFFCGTGSGADKKKAKPLTPAEVFKRSTPGIVVIDCQGENNAKSTASGFLVSANGKILTNLHVIITCQSLKVRLSNGDIYDTADVVEVDGRKDLALIRIKAVSQPVLPLGDSNDLEVGQVVYSIGNPNGLQNTLQQGLISSFRQQEGYKLVQVSASINPGNSGGPILDDQGHVVAVAVSKIQGMENLGFAVPINYAKGFLDTTTSTPFPTFAAGVRQLVAKANAGRGGNNNSNNNAAGVLGGILSPAPPSAAPPPPPQPKLIASVTPGGAPLVPRISFSTIDAFAGRPWKFEGDGRPALEVALGHVHGVAYDRAGNLYAADIGSGAIVKIDTAGTLHVLAGPDSPPQNRPVNPQQIAVDANGAVYFAEDGQRVRMISPAGEMSVIAGNDKRAFTADGAHAAGSSLSGINGVALMPDGTVVFSEWDNSRVRRVDAQGVLQTVAGDGQVRYGGDGGPARQASFNRPMGLAADAQGNLFIADQFNGRVRKVSPDGIVTTVAGGGVTTESLGCPTGVDVSRRGDVFIADPCKRRIYALRGGQLAVVGGNGSAKLEPSGQGGPATAASFDEWTVAVNDKEDVAVAGPDYGYVYRISHDGTFSIAAGTGNWRSPSDGMKATNAVFQLPNEMAVDQTGSVYLTDWNAGRIYRITRDGIVTRLTGTGRLTYSGENVAAGTADIDRPGGVRVRSDGSIVFAEAGNSNRIREITSDGKLRTLAGNGRRDYSGDGGRALNASLNGPRGVCLDSAGVIYFADWGNQRVRKILTDGTIQLVAGNGTKGFSGDGGPAERASLDNPYGIDCGPDGSLYLSEYGNRHVRRISPDGVIATVAGDGGNRFAGDGGPAVKASLTDPFDLAIGPDHALYVIDRNASRIRRIDLGSGTIETVAGNGNRGVSGDGGPPPGAGLGFLQGIAINQAGDLFISDSGGRVRLVRAQAISAANVTASPGGVGNTTPQPVSQTTGGAIQVSSDRLETFLRGKIGVWSADDAKAVMGGVRDQSQDAQGAVITFDTANTGFVRAALHFGGGGKLASAVFYPAQKVAWSAQLAYMKGKFAGDEYKLEQQGDNVLYTYPRSRTAFVVQADGSLVSMTIF
jgi:S1-C subfamily serine protease/streptogramin lyase